VIPQRRVADIISPLRPLDINAVQYHFSLSLDSLDQAFTISATIIIGLKIVIILEFKGLTVERRGLPLPALLQGIPPPSFAFPVLGSGYTLPFLSDRIFSGIA
jgi:hypothetical protein